MTSMRLVAGTLTAITALASASALDAQGRGQLQLAGAMTQSQPGPLEKRAKPITPENPVPRRVIFVAPQYPPEAASTGARTTVTLRITLDELGRMGELRLASAPLLGSFVPNPPGDPQLMPIVFNAFANAAMAAVRQWQYDPPADGPISFDVSILFGPDGEPRVVSHGTPVGSPQIGFAGAPPPPPAPPPPGPPPPWVEGAVRVGGAVTQPTKITHVSPVYPAAAQQARVMGVVILEARIEPDGRVINARVLRSIPLLDEAAPTAVKQWEFTPTLLNGNPVPVIMTVTVQFSLS